MRYQVIVSLSSDEIPKDKNRMFLSLIKYHITENDKQFFELLYAEGETKRKDFTFSLYMPECEFLMDTIKIPNKKIFLNFSTYDLFTGIQFYNAMINGQRKEYSYKGIIMKIEKIELKKEKTFMGKTAIFKSLSPCVVREHNDETNRDWFHSLDTDRGKTLFIENLKYQVLESIEDSIYDLEDIKISIIKNKEVKVKHYGIEVLANICVFEMEAKAYILEYLYKAGIGSFKSTGFGMLSTL
ncbi:CRISPR-associated endoribonuclease Cas6 [Eubacterium nodatum ATCC 33099]|nr:CRISPR-associated endoribonuclease Cas6 [Eubacterium nodatum ATCC 33099]